MEAPQLRPLGVGDIVDRVFALYRSRPLLLIAAAALPYLVFVLLIAGVTIALATSIAGVADLARIFATGEAPTDTRFLTNLIVTLIWFVLFVVVAAVVILSVQTTALVYATSSRYLGRPVSLSEVLRSGL